MNARRLFALGAVVASLFVPALASAQSYYVPVAPPAAIRYIPSQVAPQGYPVQVAPQGVPVVADRGWGRGRGEGRLDRGRADQGGWDRGARQAPPDGGRFQRPDGGRFDRGRADQGGWDRGARQAPPDGGRFDRGRADQGGWDRGARQAPPDGGRFQRPFEGWRR